MPKNNKIKSVLVIGSGPIIIGQAAEFDYSGTQAIQTLKEQGIKVILINSNPATIMTDKNLADKVYLEPLTLDFLKKIIHLEQPDSILATLGGQTALNLAIELAQLGYLAQKNIKLLGVNIESITKAEDRDCFKKLMQELDIPTPESITSHSLNEAMKFKDKIGLPLIIRPAFTLGGSGGGIAYSEQQFKDLVNSGLEKSPISQVLIERSIEGYKEIEFEVIRDKSDNCIIVCAMENLDPVGIHTGDSIVVAPCQTLNDREYQKLRSVSLEVVRALRIEGGCNVQLALNPNDEQFYIIEVNPRVSRSSALASKATGYPIAKVSSLIALGYTLDEIINPITQNSYACFEPSLDYIAIKFPRWPFDKFHNAKRELGTQMMATGEVMAIARNFESALLKAIRSLEIKRNYIEVDRFYEFTKDEILDGIKLKDDDRIFYIAHALRLDTSVEKIHQMTNIDKWFLYRIKNIIDLERFIQTNDLCADNLYKYKRYGFPDQIIARLKDISVKSIELLRHKYNIIPSFNMVDTCAGEFESITPYYYSSFEQQSESFAFKEKSILILGSGPIRIGQGIEFDYSTVHCIKEIKKLGYKAIIINNNPETVSTDFSISDKLFFEPLYIEDVMNVINNENVFGVIAQFGGQSAINLVSELNKRGVLILGTSAESIKTCEDRELFEKELRQLKIAQPIAATARSIDEALKKAKDLSYPLMLRPSYVIGGESMQVVYDDEELKSYFYEIHSKNKLILMDRYIVGLEIEIDAISDGHDVLIPGILEHIERAGIHSGDSFAVYPPQSLSKTIKENILQVTQQLAVALNIKGLINIQFVIKDNSLFVLEVNPRASRTLPFLSKVTNIPITSIACQVIMGKTLKQLGYQSEISQESKKVSVKAPVFSFTKLKLVDCSLGPEMKSTGEAMGTDLTYEQALRKAFIAQGVKIPYSGTILVTVADKHKYELLPLLKRFYDCGFDFLATPGTYKFLKENNLNAKMTFKISESENNLLKAIDNNEIDLVINTITKGKNVKSDGFRMRQSCVQKGIICLTSIDTTFALLKTIELSNTKVFSL